MDNIRKLVLYAALIVVAMLLWQNWQEEFAAGAAKKARGEIVQDNNTSAPPKDLLSAAKPQNGQITAANQVVQNSEAKITPIEVQTDVLKIQIDPKGGNLISAQLLNYPLDIKQKNIPVTLLTNNPDQIYVAQTGLINKEVGPDTETDQAIFSAKQNHYQLADGQNTLTVPLTWEKNGVQVTKLFTFTRGSYAIPVSYEIKNNSSNPWNGYFYMQLHQKEIPSTSSFLGLHTFSGASISSPDDRYQKLSYENLAKHNVDQSFADGWLAFQQRYFLTAWVPTTNQTYHYYSRNNGDLYSLGAVSPQITVASGASTNVSGTLYVGPEIKEQLEKVSPNLDMTIDFGWLWPISFAILWLMKKIHMFVHNWGWSIVIVTLLIKLAFYHLSGKSYKSMAKMRDLAPKIQALKERYGDDRQKMGQATMDLYRKEKVNPLGGCLPMVVQIPFFIALYYVLIESVELRQAPWIFWIQDLSAKDPYFVLPILMGLSMLLQQKLNPPPPDPMQAKMMMLLPVVFTVLFLAFPAGLVLYWLVNNLASIAQQSYVLYRHERSPKKS